MIIKYRTILILLVVVFAAGLIFNAQDQPSEDKPDLISASYLVNGKTISLDNLIDYNPGVTIETEYKDLFGAVVDICGERIDRAILFDDTDLIIYYRSCNATSIERLLVVVAATGEKLDF